MKFEGSGLGGWVGGRAVGSMKCGGSAGAEALGMGVCGVALVGGAL